MEEEFFFELLRKVRTNQATKQETDFIDAYYRSFEARTDPTTVLTMPEINDLKNDIKEGLKSRILLHTTKKRN
ncbi:hypothetical protein SAMN05216464_1097 [Mucilaginibacter pineti]|uniref:Uncharacterized protein n=1 Tax=Mucilaginibacter pineti TaxID=1391627 RepID=A0A1G7FD68_9SPHI|nr:hypothetical protein [Mucilaginibacter pineti]SDE73883.1 hypothetical protein SAMN05216464_1097 [Mucilaginibacter pineti]